MSSNVQVKLFGGFSINKGDEEILESLSNTRKTKLFLCYLLINKDMASFLLRRLRRFSRLYFCSNRQ